VIPATVWSGGNTVQVENVPDPAILNECDAIVRVTSTTICGSDLHLYDGYVPTMKHGDILDLRGPARDPGERAA
jgi:threonine dehydrogenase-like Zn-dependent dehydrogenase